MYGVEHICFLLFPYEEMFQCQKCFLSSGVIVAERYGYFVADCDDRKFRLILQHA